MATATGYWYTKALINVMGGETAGETSTLDYLSDNVKVALMNSFTPAQGTSEFWSDVSSAETSGTGYTAGGELLTSKAFTNNAGVVGLDAADFSVTITGSLTADHAVIYKDTGTPSTSPVLGYLVFSSAQTATDGDFDIVYDSAGLLKLTVTQAA